MTCYTRIYVIHGEQRGKCTHLQGTVQQLDRARPAGAAAWSNTRQNARVK